VQSFISDGSFVKKLRLQDIRTDRLDKWRDGEIPIYGPNILFVRDVIPVWIAIESIYGRCLKITTSFSWITKPVLRFTFC